MEVHRGGSLGVATGDEDYNQTNPAVNDTNKTPHERKIGHMNANSVNTLQTSSSMKKKLAFIKTKNINFNTLSKLSGRM